MGNTAGTFESVGKSVDTKITKGKQVMKEVKKEAGETIEKGKQSVKNAIDKTVKTVDNVATKAEQTFDNALNFLSTTYNDVSQKTKDVINSGVATAKNTFNYVKDQTSQKIDQISAAMTKLAQDAKNGLVKKITYLKDQGKIMIEYAAFKIAVDIATFKSDIKKVGEVVHSAGVKTISFAKDTGEFVVKAGVKTVKISLGAAIMSGMLVMQGGKWVINKGYEGANFVVDETVQGVDYIINKAQEGVYAARISTAGGLRNLASAIDK